MFQFPEYTLFFLCIQKTVTEVCSAGFPHSEISGSKVACHLTEAYRRLLRPSSSNHVKASTICAYVVMTQSYVLCWRRLLKPTFDTA